MMKGVLLPISALLAAVVFSGAALAEDHTGDQVLRVATDLPATSGIIKRLGLKVWHGTLEHVDVLVPKEKVSAAEAAMNEAGIAYSVIISDVQALADTQNPPLPRTRSFGGVTRMSWDRYHRLDTIYSWLRDLARRHPQRCSVTSIGRTAEGRDILIIKISSGLRNPRTILIDGGVHAREWVSPASVTWLINELVENWDSQPEELREIDWYIVPVLNPDGYEYTHTSDRTWRKNRSKSRSSYGRGCQGVDVNRNYDAKWMFSGSSADSCEEDYAGPAPNSELETKAVTSFAKTIPNLTGYVSFHSFGNYIIMPWSHQRRSYPANHEELTEVAEEAKREIREAGGPVYTIGTVADIMYPASGGSIDYYTSKLGVRFAYGVELRDDGKYAFFLPARMIKDTAVDAYLFVKNVGLAVARA